jgi:hypothetical protein
LGKAIIERSTSKKQQKKSKPFTVNRQYKGSGSEKNRRAIAGKYVLVLLVRYSTHV